MRLVEDKLLAVSKKQMETKGAQLIKSIEQPLYERTFKYWNDSKDNTEPRTPVVKFVVTIRKERGKGATLRIRSYVQNPSKRAPSVVWHLMEGGVKAHIQKKNSPPLFFRKEPRTRVKELDAQPFPGWSNATPVYIKAGTPIRATPARLWYEVIRDLTLEAIRTDPRFRNAEITKVQIIRPKLNIAPGTPRVRTGKAPSVPAAKSAPTKSKSFSKKSKASGSKSIAATLADEVLSDLKK